MCRQCCTPRNGGYCGNYYHDFNTTSCRLFITTRHLGREVQLPVTQKQPWWFRKYGEIVDGLTRHEAVSTDGDARVHRYQRVTVGLRSHKDMSIDPHRSPNNLSMVTSSGSSCGGTRHRGSAIRTEEDDGEERRRPRLLIITRRSKRRFMNLEEIVAAAEEVGFEVTALDLMPKAGAPGEGGLTNLVFLPMNAVVVQVVPLGRMEALAMDEYGVPPRDMNMRYLQYNITAEESTLSELYLRGHPRFPEPRPHPRSELVARQGDLPALWDVRLDIARFRPVLQKALDLLR
ncbi:hypothetical protein QYE76_037298 [Lolium multiflorum]|uniref:Uncharacterized protein n=1 Tax=Lolium multiflorum TaxID=4521 RepID=A0AAD8VFC7_LOLMU|nr:hypothetical protein QYE76_037298 [Lolium multiflorum]